MAQSQKTTTYPNFYENVKEANLRLRGTVVLYDGFPYYVAAIAGGHADGIFRVYMEPLGDKMNCNSGNPMPVTMYPVEHTAIMQFFDEWMKANPSPIIRKQMNSPLFNKFRPFPLGMVNTDGRTYYTERQPTRKTEQGLTMSMIQESRINISEQGPGRGSVPFFSEVFRDAIIGVYPSPQECVNNLVDQNVMNDAVGFARHFALVRGPAQTIFLGHKSSVIGVLPDNNLSTVRLSKKAVHLKETVAELNLFNQILS